MADQNLEQLEKSLRDIRNRFVLLTSPHRPALWNFCLKLTGSPWDAEDLLQDTLLKAFSRMALLGQAIDLKAYLFRMASNAWIDQKRHLKTSFGDLDSAEETASDQATGFQAESREAMEILVSTLPPRQRVILLLSDMFDFKAYEVAGMLDTSEGAVKAALHRARGSLKKLQTETPELHRARTGLTPPDPLISRYIDAFNRRDPEALVALLDKEAVNEIVGDWEEHGTDMMKKSSLHYWSLEEGRIWVEYGTLFGKSVLFGFREHDGHPKVLAEILSLQTAEDRVVSQKWYFFCPELLEYAASLLGVPAKTWGYTFDQAYNEDGTLKT
ncbi:MAG: sigma-70 family RNA polymerase sigma factor [Ignavibacteriales bacterium]|nr:sigma-70 family RNA polymerase sigma factor [Ignavibacteriales bacterium]